MSSFTRDADSPAGATFWPARAFYATGSSGVRAWWTVLHPPYTLWHLGYVAIGAGLAPSFDIGRLLGALAAFGLAVGIAAHAFDELNGRPLGTTIPSRALVAAGVASLAVSAGLCVAGVRVVGPGILVLLALGVVFVLGYNLELFGGRLHTDRAFALTWGAFPVLVAGFAQSASFEPAYFVGALFAYWSARAQRELSLRARELRRKAEEVSGTIRWREGGEAPITVAGLLGPLEHALRSLCLAVPAAGLALVLARL